MEAQEIELSDAIQRICDVSPHYGRWDFESAAEFRRMGAIEHPDGGLVSSDTYGSNFYNNTEEKWRHVTNARAIRDLLEEADSGCGWEYGPADTFVYDLDNPAIVAVVESVESRLADYPFLNEDSYTEEVWEENHPSETECHAGSDCDCYVNSHECSEVLWNAYEAGALPIAEGEWYCAYCDKWYKITAQITDEMAMREFRKQLADAEAAGQLCLF
ncbi:hypothetical protein [Kitasatospora cineracea]|uniref:hypothetical protein n=1 Tax=Kitasatospora cineracea TaxID=88074 RepID=UPI00382A5BCE